MIERLLFEHDGALRTSFLTWQLGIGTALPLVLIALALTTRLRGALLKAVGVIVGCLGLVQTVSLLWNVVIGGQLMSKSFRGVSSYTPPVGGREGLLVAAGILLLPVVTFLVISLVLPLRPSREELAAPSAS